MTEEARGGRRRSEACERAVLDAAWRLLAIRPLSELSIEAIAREAGVGKTTIYRWWPSKAAIAMDAFLERYLPETPFPNAATAEEALRKQMASVVRAFRGDVGRIIVQIAAEAQADPEALRVFRERFVLPRRRAAVEILERGVASGEFDPELDAELAIDLLYGPIWLRLLIGHLPLDEDFAEALPRAAMRSLARAPR